MTPASNLIGQLEFRTRRLVVDRLAPESENRVGHKAGLIEVARILTPAVLMHLPEPLRMPDGANQAESWVAARQAESFLYAVREANTAAIVGLMILADTSEFDATVTLRLGYLFGQFAWGHGYATELVKGLVQELDQFGWSG